MLAIAGRFANKKGEAQCLAVEIGVGA